MESDGRGDGTGELAEALAEARRLLAIDAADATLQPLFEQWLKAEQWRAQGEALPLLVGCAPARWGQAAGEAARGAAQPLWQALVREIGCAPADDPPLSPFRLRQWAQREGLALPSALTRVLDFIGAVLPALAVPVNDTPIPGHDEDRVTLLGAALAMVTRYPARCVDAEGYYDAARIVAQVFAQAVVWFPLGPPAFSQADAVALVARWLPDAPGTFES